VSQSGDDSVFAARRTSHLSECRAGFTTQSPVIVQRRHPPYAFDTKVTKQKPGKNNYPTSHTHACGACVQPSTLG